MAVFQAVTIAAHRKCGMIIVPYRECASSTGFFIGERPGRTECEMS